MPLALEPSATFRVVLRSDKGKSPEPWFEFRYVSGREWKELTRETNRIIEAADGPAAIDAEFDLIRRGLVGWGNMIDPATGKEKPFDPAELDTLLTIGEAGELLARFRDQGIEVEDKKKSPSPSGSGTESSVKTAPDPVSA